MAWMERSEGTESCRHTVQCKDNACVEQCGWKANTTMRRESLLLQTVSELLGQGVLLAGALDPGLLHCRCWRRPHCLWGGGLVTVFLLLLLTFLRLSSSSSSWGTIDPSSRSALTELVCLALFSAFSSILSSRSSTFRAFSSSLYC